MAKNKGKNSYGHVPPPPRETQGGGATEHAQLQWLIQSQNQVNHCMGSFESKLDNIDKTLSELKLDSRDNNTLLGKLEKKLLFASAFLAGGVLVGGFLVSNFIDGKFNTVIQKIEAAESKKTKTPPKPKKPE